MLMLHTASLVVYLLGLQLLSSNFVLIFIVTILLLAIDFYYLKNIAGRRLVGLRWWNEVDSTTGDGRWVFESAEPESRDQNATDKRFFWMALYIQPVLWVVLAIFALIGLKFIWLTLVGKFMTDGTGLERMRGIISWKRANFFGSYCACPHNHEYPCLFAMRQVQPG